MRVYCTNEPVKDGIELVTLLNDRFHYGVNEYEISIATAKDLYKMHTEMVAALEPDEEEYEEGYYAGM